MTAFPRHRFRWVAPSVLGVVLSLMACRTASAQVFSDSVRVYFQQGKADFDPFFEGNARAVTEFINGLRRIQRDSLLTVGQVRIAASASPEGTPWKNERLAHERARRIADYLSERIRFDRDALTVDYTPVDWALLERLVRENEDVPWRDDVLEALRWQDIDELRRVRGGKPWSWMYRNLFPALRQTFVVLTLDAGLQLPDMDEAALDEVAFSEMEWPDAQPALDTWMPFVPLLEYRPGRNLYLKTNLLTWGLLEANIAVEAELSDHLSLSVPVYYTALDWFNVRTKFRIFGTQPELRWWPLRGFKGPFVAAHGSFGWYNVTWKTSRYRYQDRGTRTPAYGGGLNLGWKFRLGNRWGLELSVGGGYLHLDYDLFWNEANGAWVDSRVRDYWGFDHAALTLTWRIPVTKARLL